MNTMNMPDCRGSARAGGRRFSRSARSAAIRHATTLGSILAFALLCMLSMRANAVTVFGAERPVQPAGHLRAAAAVAVLMTVISLGGWCRAHVAIKRLAATLRGVESEWQRRYDAVESRELATRMVAEGQATAAATQERERIHAAIRLVVSGPLTALSGLLELLRGATLPSAERSLAGKLHFGMGASVRVLEDMVAPPSVEPHATVLDETLIDLRELIDGVVALFAPIAARKGVYLTVSTDRSVAARILADSERLGQIVFHLLNRALHNTKRGAITIAVRAESLNAGSQRVFISVRQVGAALASSVDQSSWLVAAVTPPREADDDADSNLVLCKRLAQQMRGELVIDKQPDCGAHATLSAPFAIEHASPFISSAGAHDLPGQHAASADPAHFSDVAQLEPFDRTYLAALASEGIDLHKFVRGWSHSIHDDLQLLRSLKDPHDVRGLLHRLSGVVGLVGACSLMEALRRASAAQSAPEASAIEALAKRSEALMIQLEEGIDLDRSQVP